MSTDLDGIRQRSVIAWNTLVRFSFTVIGARAAPGQMKGLRFYRATLRVSAVFAVARCLSVCLSVTFVHSLQTAEAIVKLLCRP